MLRTRAAWKDAMEAPRPHVWLAATNGIWLLGGLLAYLTRASLVLGTAVAIVAALPALLELRRTAANVWFDRALAAALGTWAVMAVLIVTPYMATEEGISLWTSRGYAATGLAAASIGMLLWNLSTFNALDADKRTGLLYAAFHVILLGVAMYLVATGDGGSHDIMLRGDTYAVVDLRLAPALASLAALPWAGAFLRVRDAPA